MQTQARRLRRHFPIEATLKRLEHALDGAFLAELKARYFPPACAAELARRVNRAPGLFAEWSVTLFKRRIAHWSLLGIVVWPVALAGAALGGLRRWVPTGGAAREDDPFRVAGV